MPLKGSRALLGASLAAVYWCLASSPAWAQTVPGALPSREQVEIPRSTENVPNSSATVRDESARAAACPFANSPIEVRIDRLRYVQPDGSALPDDVAKALAGIAPAPEARKLAQLCELRDSAASSLRAHGYVAGVTIPPQEIATGEATLTVILARLTDVHIEGAPGPYRRALESRIALLKSLSALNTREIERILLAANDMPGLQVAMNLRAAGTGPGQVIGELTVRYTPFTILANVQNTGSRTLGRESGTVRLEYYGLTGHSDRTFIGASSTLDVSEQQVVQVGQYFGTDGGTTFGGRFSYAWSRPELGALEFRSHSLIGGIDISTPLARTVRGYADIGGGFELIQQTIQLKTGAGGIPVTQDKLRVGYLRLSGNLHKPQFTGGDRWSLAGSLELRKGFDILGATETATITSAGYTPSRFDGVASATVVRAGVNGFVGIGKLFSISATGQAQWASDPLLSFEEFSVGNLTLGRGYDPGVTAGDKALGGRIEPRVLLPIKSKVGAQAFGFYDIVRIWNDDPFTTENKRNLRSFGGGIRAWLPGVMSLEAMYAHPTDPELEFPGAPRASDRVLLTLTVQFSPRH
jgi:hemolysin activation/secretion protein